MEAGAEEHAFSQNAGQCSELRMDSREGPQFSTKKNLLGFLFGNGPIRGGVYKGNARPPREIRFRSLLSAMARLSLIAFLTLAFSGVAHTAVALGGIRARGWREYSFCGGTWVFASLGLNCGTQWYCHGAGTSSIHAVYISPDPPVSGEKLMITVDAWARGEIKVRPSNCSKCRWLTTGFRTRHPSSSIYRGVMIPSRARP